MSPPSPINLTRVPRNGSSSTTVITSGPIGNIGGCMGQNNINRPSHGQIIANIENNPVHYERDWTLDDSSQSSFKPCPQGSGSMTPLPFHDSVHNMYDTAAPVRSSSHSTNGSIGSDLNQMPNTKVATSSATVNNHSAGSSKTNDLNLFKINTNSMNFPNSAVFLENSDILNDAEYPKLYHRHSTVFVSPEINDNLDNKYPIKDTRRYSDTKLLHHQNTNGTERNCGSSGGAMPIFNVTNVLGVSIPSATVTTVDEQSNAITDIIFENSGQSNFDPLELNIQEMLELDVHQHHRQHDQQHATTIKIDPTKHHNTKTRLSLHNVSSGNIDGTTYAQTENRNFFKSLPNLSASSENLLQK